LKCFSFPLDLHYLRAPNVGGLGSDEMKGTNGAPLFGRNSENRKRAFLSSTTERSEGDLSGERRRRKSLRGITLRRYLEAVFWGIVLLFQLNSKV